MEGGKSAEKRNGRMVRVRDELEELNDDGSPRYVERVGLGYQNTLVSAKVIFFHARQG